MYTEEQFLEKVNNIFSVPQNWNNEGTTECFKNEILPTILNEIEKEQDIVSTSSESQSSQQAEQN